MLEFPQPAITKSRTAETGTNSKRTCRGKPNRISPVIITCDCQVEPKRNVISGSPVLQVAGARMCRTSACRPGSLFAVFAAGKKLMCRLFILLVSCEKEKYHSFVVPSYGRQFRRGIGQERPLLLSHEVSRSYRIMRLRTRTKERANQSRSTTCYRRTVELLDLDNSEWRRCRS